MGLAIFVAACISGYIFYTQVPLIVTDDKVFKRLISNILSNNNDGIRNIFVMITVIIISTFTSNKQSNASLISCYPENNVKPSLTSKFDKIEIYPFVTKSSTIMSFYSTNCNTIQIWS